MAGVAVHVNHGGGMTPQPDDEAAVSINRVHLSLPMVATVGVTAIAAVLSLAAAWYAASGHAADHTVHAIEADAVRGGGIAYKADVAKLRSDVDQVFVERKGTIDGQFRDNLKSVRKTLRKMTMSCRAGVGGGLNCRVELPDEE